MAQFLITNTPQEIGFECGRKTTQRTLQNVKNLLMCRMGEVPYDRFRGFDNALFDLPLSEMREALLPELDRMLLWEPAAEVVDAACELDAQGHVLIAMTVEVAEREEVTR